MSLTPELASWRDRIRAVALEQGLDFFEVVFELLSWEQINEVAAYGGFPTRYPHWRFGMEFEHLTKSHAYGLSKIYELVINNDPSVAYLQESNEVVDQKLVMAHVYGHSDFFKNNIFFGHTNRKMIDTMATHATRIRRHMDRIGQERVEDFIDAVLSLENLIDANRVFLDDRSNRVAVPKEEDEPIQVGRIRAKEYLDPFVNPPGVLEEERQRLERERAARRRVPERPERDVLLFLIQFAPLERWQQDVLDIVREESYYFLPQMQTKIMNEGWASYWHTKIMTEFALDASELIDYAEKCAGVFSMPPGNFNPYKVGLELFRDIERRWNRGQFGTAWEECEDQDEKARWDLGLGRGKEKIFEVRRLYNDVTFLDTFLTPEFCDQQQLFVHRYNERTKRREISDREFDMIKMQLLTSLTNGGQPIIKVVESNYENRGELLLEHDHQGLDLDLGYARATMANLQRIWGRPVHILTGIDGKERIYSHDGTAFKETLVA